MKKTAFLFAGQGSQTLGMGKDFLEHFSDATVLFEEANDALGFNLQKIIDEDKEKLEQTMYAQPAILLISQIAYRAFQKELSCTPAFAIGHSLGEFSALTASGALTLTQAVKLVHQRGLFMAQECEGKETGMMVVLNLSDELVESICEDARHAGKKVWPVNYNSDGQIVIAGIKADLAELEKPLKDAGAKRALLLNMSVCSHCEILLGAAQKLKPLLQEYIHDDFAFQIVSNVTTNKYSSKNEAVSLLEQQLISPVRYKQSIARFDNEVDAYIEFGNGAVLAGLNKKITTKPTFSVNSYETAQSVARDIQNEA